MKILRLATFILMLLALSAGVIAQEMTYNEAPELAERVAAEVGFHHRFVSTREMDALYELPYTRRPHPRYGDANNVGGGIETAGLVG